MVEVYVEQPNWSNASALKISFRRINIFGFVQRKFDFYRIGEFNYESKRKKCLTNGNNLET